MALSPMSLVKAEALKALSSLKPEEFDDAASRYLASSESPTIKATILLDRFAEVFGDRKYSAALCSQLVAFATIRRIEASTIEDVFGTIVGSMHANGLDSGVQDWFNDCREAFLKLAESSSVRLVAKALHLTTDFSEIMIGANIITDIRPVFANDRDEVIGGVVLHNLRLHYISGNGKLGEEELSLALDVDDISKLIDELEKAKKKAEASASFLAESLKGNVVVAGEDRYGFS